MIIISGANRNRYGAPQNHELYAKKWGYEYKFYHFDVKDNLYPHEERSELYKIPKVWAGVDISIVDALQKHDEVLWIDDDAFFVDFDWDCRDIYKLSDKPLIMSEDPVITGFSTPIFNAGVNFFRKNSDVINMVSEAPHLSDKEVIEKWDPAWGDNTGNNQPRWILLTQTKYKDVCHIASYNEGFNHAPWDYNKKSTKIIHFCGWLEESGFPKDIQIKKFSKARPGRAEVNFWPGIEPPSFDG